jgi:hypothetical protein
VGTARHETEGRCGWVASLQEEVKLCNHLKYELISIMKLSSSFYTRCELQDRSDALALSQDHQRPEYELV